MTPPGHSPSTQPVDCDTVHLLITPAVADLTHDLDRDCHYTHLHTQAQDRNRVLVEPPRDGTQSCLYHIVAAFVGQSMTQVCRDLGAWHLQPANQARLRDMLPTNLQSPAQWSRRSRSALNPSNLADECYVYSWALLFDVSFQIMSLPTSVQVININGMRGMTIGHVNSTRVKRFVATKLIRNTGNISSTVTHDTTEVSASHQNVTQNKRHKVNVPPDPELLPTSDLPQLTPRHYSPPSQPTTHYPLIPAPTSRTLHPTITLHTALKNLLFICIPQKFLSEHYPYRPKRCVGTVECESPTLVLFQ